MAYRHIPSGRIQPQSKTRSFVKRKPEGSVACSTGRYYPGEELYGIAFSYTNHPMSSYSSPMMWDSEFPKEIHIIKLRVTEHHKVPSEYDESPEPEKVYDGYLLIDSKDRVFTNQYPRASYGQLSDTGNRVFTEDVQGDYKARLDNDKSDPVQYILITDIYANICKGIRDITRLLGETHNPLRQNQGDEYNHFWSKRNQLEKLRDSIQAKFAIVSTGKVLYAKPRFRGAYLQGGIANTKQEAWAAMYVPVSSKHALIEAVKKVKRHLVDPHQRVDSGFYHRLSVERSEGYIDISRLKLGGFLSRKKYSSRHGRPKHTPAIPGRYRVVYTHPSTIMRETLKGSYGCFISDYAHSAVLLKSCADVQNLQKVFAANYTTGFELGVLFKGWPDTRERFVEYMQDVVTCSRLLTGVDFEGDC